LASEDSVAVSESLEPNNVPRQADINGIIDRARRATQRRDWLEAWRCWEAVRGRSPDHAPAYLGSGNALREAGRYEEAELVLGAGAERFPDNEQIAVARAWLANARHDWSVALSRWEALRVHFPDNPSCYVGNVHALRGLGRSDQVETLLVSAEATLVAAKQQGLDEMAALKVEFAIARARLDWPAVRQCAGRIIACEEAPSAQVFLAVAQACWYLGNPEEADRAAVRASSIDPTLSEAVLVRAWVATDRGDGETALSCYRTLVKLNPGALRWSLKLVHLLNCLGRAKEALTALENVRRRWPTHPMVRNFLRNPSLELTFDATSAVSRTAEGDLGRAQEKELRAIADKDPGPAERVRPILVADPERDVLIAEVTGAETAVLVFTANNDGVSMPLPVFDRYLATLDLTAIYLKDFQRLRYLLGIQSLSQDYQGTLAALRDILSRLGVKRLCTIGNCVGGFAAIRYGVELCADRVLTFGTPTYLSPDPLTPMEPTRHFMRNRLAANVPGEMLDLRPFLEARQHNTQIELFYEEDDPVGRIHALHLSDLPGIRFHPLPGPNRRTLQRDPHAAVVGDRGGVLRRLALSRGDFQGMLGSLLGVGPATSNG
jgi:tetratricopeptide (TPR) repeat protein